MNLSTLSILPLVAGSLLACKGDPAPATPATAAPKAVPVTGAGPAPVRPATTTTPEPKPAVSAAAPADEGWLKSLTREGDTTLRALFDAELARAKAAQKTVVIMFSADWCTPCRTIKDMITDSPAVQSKLADISFIIIDVDAWRGPAHRLIDGAVPNKLPLLVAVGNDGQALAQTYGTALGLLSEDVVADNLLRLSQGKTPAPAAYEKDSKARRDLLMADIKKKKDKAAQTAPFEAKVIAVNDAEKGLKRWRVDLTLRNHEASRRWYALPPTVAAGPAPKPKDTIAFTEARRDRFTHHVRATVNRYLGERPITLVPVAGWGHVTLKGWVVETAADVDALEVWKLTSVNVDDDRLRFEKKVAYALEIDDASSFERGPALPGGTLSLRIGERYPIKP